MYARTEERNNAWSLDPQEGKGKGGGGGGGGWLHHLRVLDEGHVVPELRAEGPDELRLRPTPHPPEAPAAPLPAQRTHHLSEISSALQSAPTAPNLPH